MLKGSIPQISSNKKKHKSLSFPDFLCGGNNYLNDSFGKVSVDIPPCTKTTNLSAIYFIMGQHNEDDGHPQLVGLDCLFEDSQRIYACSGKHLFNIINEILNKDDYGDISGKFPDVIFDSHYTIKKNVQIRIFNDLGYFINKSYFTDLDYSYGRESLDSLWKREKWHLI